MQPETQTRGVKPPTEQQLRFGIPTPDAAHIMPALFGGEDVHIRRPLLLLRR